MAKETHGTTGMNSQYENPALTYAGYATETMKEIWNWQFKTSQACIDQSVRYGQTYADYLQTQMTESSKLAQDFFKMGTHLADEVRKGFTGLTEKVNKAQP